MNNKLVLGIETSCDDTSICILEQTSHFPNILSHVSFSQEQILKKWGGVVPEIAARNHLQKITPLLDEAFTQAQIKPKDIDIIGVTTIPGLLGPLLTGLNAAKTISLLYEKPIVSVNHLYAHLEAIHITEEVSYPYLGLLVSGGHSVFFWVTSKDNFEVIGSTIDDAAGEAFDKGGKLLKLGYPAGRTIDALSKFGDPLKYDLPIGLKKSADARMSFSGLKTALRLKIEQNPELIENIPTNLDIADDQFKAFYDLCASYQYAIVQALSFKCKYALKIIKNKYNQENFPIIIGGGVACNSSLRQTFTSNFKNIHIVKPQFCTDNGAMIANYALRNSDTAIEFPDCLGLDSRGRFIDKKEFS